jgi:hypothetical protein
MVPPLQLFMAKDSQSFLQGSAIIPEGNVSYADLIFPSLQRRSRTIALLNPNVVRLLVCSLACSTHAMVKLMRIFQ